MICCGSVAWILDGVSVSLVRRGSAFGILLLRCDKMDHLLCLLQFVF